MMNILHVLVYTIITFLRFEKTHIKIRFILRVAPLKYRAKPLGL